MHETSEDLPLALLEKSEVCDGVTEVLVACTFA